MPKVPVDAAPLGRGRTLLLRIALLALFAGGVGIGVQSVIGLVWFVPYAGVGTLLVFRRPRQSISWLVLAMGWPFALAMQELHVPASAFSDRMLDPVTAVAAVLTSIAGMVGFYLIALLAMVFPSGHLPRGRWGAVTRIAGVTGAATLVLGLGEPVISVSLAGSPTAVTVPNPLAVLPDLPLWRIVTPDTVALALVAVMVLGVASLVVRYRASGGIERRQLQWLVSALVFVVVGVIGGFILGLLAPALADTGWIWLGAIVAFPCVPIAIGIAVLRYRLYEIDRIVSRTIGWTLTTGLVAAVFGLLIVGLQALLAPITDQGTLVVAGSTLGAAALFRPLYRRVQAAVDRRFNRARIDAQRALERFGNQLRDEVDLDAVSGHLLGVAAETVQPRGLGLWMRSGGATG